MPLFAYEALDKGGRQVRGTIDAASDEVIILKLRDMGFYPLKVEINRRRGGGKMDLSALPIVRVFFHRIKTRHIATFTRQLATLIDAGLPIMRALTVLREQVESPVFKEKITVMAQAIESGHSLSEAMSRHPKIFDRLYVNMVRAGELGGVLETVLNRIADYLEKREALKGKVKSALTYPMVVMTLAAIIVSFILIVIMPKFQAVYAQLGAELPAPTLLLVYASHVLVHQTWLIAVVAALAWFALRSFKRNPLTCYHYDLALLKLPVFGDLFCKLAIARFSGTLSTLISAGVPILQALDIVRDSAGNEVIARAMARVYASVRDGETIHEPLAQFSVFPPLLVHMLAIGEETGAIDQMLTKVAEAYEREVDDTVSALTSILEPVLLVFLGVLIGGVVIALYLPLFDIIKHIGNP